MPSSLPDPVLALSLASVQKLNNVDLDQLANLWNGTYLFFQSGDLGADTSFTPPLTVFTKCKESLESGRRLENLSWRLWFREAHLLPPDTSLSDLADFTPLDTPLMSRRGSITGSFPSSRPTNTTAFPSLVAVDGQLAAVNDAPLSDPESVDWSDDDNDNLPVKELENRGRTPTRTEAGLSESNHLNKESPAKIVAPVKAIKRESSTSKATTIMAEASTSTSHADGLTTPGGLLGGLLDRKRAVSSSSAFGSRARVKQHNTARRRRPLSFQQAIESLLDRSKDFRQHNGSAPQSTSLKGTADVGIDTDGSTWRSEGLVSGHDAVAIDMQQNSAPAEFNQLDTAPSVQVISPAPNDVTRLEEERKSLPPPIGVPSRAKEALKREDVDAIDRAKESKFFMAGQSVDDGASSVSESLPPSQYSPKQQRRQENSPPTRPTASRRAPSEAASDQSSHQQATRRGQQQSHHHQHGHGKSASHGMTAGGGRNRSAVNLSRTTAGPSVAKGKGSGRVASSGSTGSSKQADGQTESKEKQAGARVPVKFSLSGGDDDDDYDDDDFTDDDSEKEEKPRGANASRKAPLLQKRDSKQENDVDEDNEWSSASSTDSEELQRRVVARRKQEEVERQQSMFQKKPIKSASTADVRNVGRRSSAPIEGSNNVEPPSLPIQPAVRGLLSSLFHPEEGPHPPPGQLAGRPHASAADLRMKPSRQAESRPRTEDFKMTTIPSTTQVPSIGGGALKLSKSAVALPVLSTLGSRSEAKRGHEAKGSRDSAVFDDDESADGSEGGSEYGTSEALARLNQLAYKKKEKQREGKRQSKSRQSNKSLNVEVAPELDEETIMAIRRREAGATPVLAGSRPGSQVPETSMPQTPRTTRRNMLRDELSESLRQSLLWERQSRNRMLGIGALDSNPRNQGNQSSAGDNRSRSMNRNQTVLGGGQLRPLTSSSSVTNMGEQQPQQRQQRRQQQMNSTDEATSNSNVNTAHRSYTGDFHHAGW